MSLLRFSSLPFLFCLALTLGCGGGEEHNQEYTQKDPHVATGESLKSSIAQIESAYRTEGPEAAAASAMSMVENIGGLTDEEKGEHAETIAEIEKTATQLQGMLESNGARGQITERIDALKRMADTLPGEAPSSPDSQDY